jgi:hypothetical protein
MAAPKWAVGFRRLAPGVYVDEATKSIHFSEEEICEIMGVPPTEANCRAATEAAVQAVREIYGNLPVEVVD